MTTTPANAMQRDSVLLYARRITPPEVRGSATTVMANALPLLEWIEAAPDEKDLRTRIRALSQAANCVTERETLDIDPPESHEFLNEAARFYNFMTGGAR